MIYWIVVLGGGAVAISGYLLMFPFYGTDIAGMQVAQIVHGIVAVLFVAVMLGHIYIGTIGMEGAFEAMGTGTSTSTGPRSTTASGSRRSWPRAAPARRRRRPDAGGRVAARSQIQDCKRPASAGRFFHRGACEPVPAAGGHRNHSHFPCWVCSAKMPPGPRRACAPTARRGGAHGLLYNRPMRIIGLAGWSGSGKTTLLTKVIPRLVGARAHGLDAQARPSRLRRRPAGQGLPHPSHGRRDRGAGRLGATAGR